MNQAVRPFRIAIAPDEVADLRSRLGRTRWPDEQTVDDWSQGVPLAYLRELCEYWALDYDWWATQDRLNQFPQIVTSVDGNDIHAFTVRSPHPDAVPLILTHGWPGSILEFEATLGPLIDPPSFGGAAEDAFDVVVPSLPGYGFSDRPDEPGWDIHRIARAWCELMTRLGYDRFIAAGSDWGTSVSTSIALQQPDRLIGLVLVPPSYRPGPMMI